MDNNIFVFCRRKYIIKIKISIAKVASHAPRVPLKINAAILTAKKINSPNFKTAFFADIKINVVTGTATAKMLACCITKRNPPNLHSDKLKLVSP